MPSLLLDVDGVATNSQTDANETDQGSPAELPRLRKYDCNDVFYEICHVLQRELETHARCAMLAQRLQNVCVCLQSVPLGMVL